MISCNTATVLIEKSHTDKLRCAEKISLRFHTLMCEACGRYRIQSTAIENTLNKHMKTIEEKTINSVVTEHAIQKILKNIQ
jgi:hypothetical protein